MYYLLTIALLVGQSALEIRVTYLDGSRLEGTVEAWDDRNVQLSVAGNRDDESLPISQILRVDLIPSAKATEKHSDVAVGFVDGSYLAATNYQSTTRRCSLDVDVADANELSSLEIPLETVGWVRLMEVPQDFPQIEREWRDLLASQHDGDLIVIRKPGAQNLNFVEGTLGDVSASGVQFSLDEQTLDVNRAKVFGMVYFRGIATDEPPSASAIVEGPGMRIAATSVTFDDGNFVVQNPHLGTIELPETAVTSIDYSVDRLQYLSDLDFMRLQWTPPPATAPLAPLFGTVARDRGFYREALTVEYPADSLASDESNSAGLSQIVAYDKGLAIRSRTEFSVRVPRGFRWFRAVAGIDPQTRATGEVELIVLGDGAPLIRQVVAGPDAPHEIQCPVDGTRELTIIVDFGPSTGIDSSAGDNLHLGGARFTK